MRVFLVRHPRPSVAAGICYGSTDVAVDEHELARVAAAVRQTAPAAGALFSSPLARCAALARRLEQAPCQLDPRLAELHFGAWEMCAWDDIPRADIDAWAADPVHYRPGGGESVLQMAARVQAFRIDLMRQACCAAVLVCHAGTIRLMTALHHGSSLEASAHQAAATPHKIGYGDIVALDF